MLPESFRSVVLCVTLVTAALAWTGAALQGQSGTVNGEWRTFGGDLGSTRYAPVDQIAAANFSKLEIAWRFKTDVFGPRPDFNLQATPLMVGGVHTGDIVWQVPHGETPDSVRDHPALKGITIPKTGRIGPIGTLTTKTLLISGESGFSTLPSGQRGARLFAYDKATGAVVGTIFMPAPQTGTPMTYMLNGRQYLVLAVGGGTYSAELLAYALPS